MFELTLKMFNIQKSIKIKIDASDLAIETYLSQKYKEKWHFITYYSKKLLLIEQNYDIYNKELLIIITALKN